MSAFHSYIPQSLFFEIRAYAHKKHSTDDAVVWLRDASDIAHEMPTILQCKSTNDLAKSITTRIKQRHTKANKTEIVIERDRRFISNFYYTHDESGQRTVHTGGIPKLVEKPETYNAVVKSGDWICKRLNTSSPTGNTKIRSKKYLDEKFWCRKLRRVVQPLREEYLYKLGMVGKYTSNYSSYNAQRTRKNMLNNQKKWARQQILKSEDGSYEELLSDVIEEKEKGYRAKITAKAAGLNKYAKANGLTAAMITVTCPGTFRKDGTTIRDGLNHLRAVWKRSLAEVNKQQLRVAGLMVWQPHKDALPHQHIYIIGSENDISEAYDIINNRALAVYPDEEGGKENRTDIKWQDDKQGSLSSYGLSYVIRYAKDEDEDEDDGEACEKDGSAQDAWYSINGCRRIGWFGLPSDTHWSSCAQTPDWQIKEIKDESLLEMIDAAKKGDYCEWMTLCGGIAVKRKERKMESIRVERESNYGEKIWRYIGSVINNIDIIVRKATPLIIEKIKSAVVIPNYLKGSVLPVSQPAAP